jgi:hypothetical protein
MAGDTAGAQRNRLPSNLPSDTKAITYASGHLPGNVYKDGRIEFKFEQVVENDVRYRVSDKYRNRSEQIAQPIPCIIDIKNDLLT